MVDQGGEQDKVLAPHARQFFSPSNTADKSDNNNSQIISSLTAEDRHRVVKAKLRYI